VLRGYIDRPIKRVALRARFTRPWWRRRFHDFGEGAILHRPNWVFGPHLMTVGRYTMILHGAWLSVEREAWEATEPVLRIGAGVGIRPYCTISAAESVVIEDNVVLSAFSTVVDSDHTFARGEASVLKGPLATGPIRIGRGTWIGERCAILRGADIGRRCIIGANSVVRGRIPDNSVAVGAPARVVGTTEPE
jgi:acetyltransferase-like isoleucine patch superfamily enzyme